MRDTHRPTPSRVPWPSRRDVLARSAAGAALVLMPAPAVLSAVTRPRITHGVQVGDVSGGDAVVWSRADRDARMIVTYATHADFRDGRSVVGPWAGEDTDHTAKLVLTGLPRGREVHYRVTFTDGDDRAAGDAVTGRFRTPPAAADDVSFVWSADTCGQGWGIDIARGGLAIYETMRRHRPDFLLHLGDVVYADNPLVAERPLADGTVWRNLMTPEKSRVAETLPDFRGQFTYPLMDDSVRRFNAEVPIVALWDDHEVVNNWYPGKRLSPDWARNKGYTIRDVDVLARRARRAFHEFLPIRPSAADPGRVHRVIRFGPRLDVFLLDGRSFRAANGPNRQPAPGPETAFFGQAQLDGLKRHLRASRATWKVIAASQPIGLPVADRPDGFDNIANGDASCLGREHELADLLAVIAREHIENVVWVTADVHHTAALHYDPARARVGAFRPFWEFVSGPLHAATGVPKQPDDTFGPHVVFARGSDGSKGLPPAAERQFFGHVRIDGPTGRMTVMLRDGAGRALFRQRLMPVAG